jgi:hypothetical protein
MTLENFIDKMCGIMFLEKLKEYSPRWLNEVAHSYFHEAGENSALDEFRKAKWQRGYANGVLTWKSETAHIGTYRFEFGNIHDNSTWFSWMKPSKITVDHKNKTHIIYQNIRQKQDA